MTEPTPKQQYQAAWHAVRQFRRDRDWRTFDEAHNGFTSFAYHSLSNRNHPLKTFTTRRIHKDNCRWDGADAANNCYYFYGICGVLQLDAEIYGEES